MTTFLLLVIIGFMIYFAAEHHKEKKAAVPEMKRKKILPEYVGRECEIIVKEPMPSIDVMYKARGVLRDVDGEWIELECSEKKKKMIKIFRISNIEGVKEIV